MNWARRLAYRAGDAWQVLRGRKVAVPAHRTGWQIAPWSTTGMKIEGNTFGNTAHPNPSGITVTWN